VLLIAKYGAVWLVRKRAEKGRTTRDVFAIVFAALMMAVLTAERIGIHGLFGAFLLGTLIPQDSALARDIRNKCEDLVLVLLLPVFFAFTGMRTKIESHLATVASQHRPFQLHLRGTGTFRPVTQVVFVAVAAGISACEQLAGDIRSGPLARELRYPYHPHVTVAHDVARAALDAVFDGLASFEARFPVDSFTLYEHGPEHRWRPLRRFALTG